MSEAHVAINSWRHIKVPKQYRGASLLLWLDTLTISALIGPFSIHLKPGYELFHCSIRRLSAGRGESCEAGQHGIFATRGQPVSEWLPSFLFLYNSTLILKRISYGPNWPPSEPALAAVANNYGHQARDIFHDGDIPGRPLSTYVNYASSDKTPEMLYGYEPWRLEKLRGLKKKYDPR